MPYTSAVLGFSLACQDEAEINALQPEEFYFSSSQG